MKRPTASRLGRGRVNPLNSAILPGPGKGRRAPISPYARKGRPGNLPRIDALLRGKRYRPDELLIEVPNDGSGRLKEHLAHDYGVEIRDIEGVKALRARFFRLKLGSGQSLHALLARLLRDPRVMKVQPDYIYTPARPAPQQGHAPAAEPGQGGGTAQIVTGGFP